MNFLPILINISRTEHFFTVFTLFFLKLAPCVSWCDLWDSGPCWLAYHTMDTWIEQPCHEWTSVPNVCLLLSLFFCKQDIYRYNCSSQNYSSVYWRCYHNAEHGEWQIRRCWRASSDKCQRYIAVTTRGSAPRGSSYYCSHWNTCHMPHTGMVFAN